MILDLTLLSLSILLLLLQGFFSGSEMALVTADKIKLQAQALQGNKQARQVLAFFQNPERLLATTLVGTNLAVVAQTTLGTILMMRWWGDSGEFLAILFYTPLLLTLGEVVPKSIFQQKATLLSARIIAPLRVFYICLYPVIFLFSAIARYSASLAGLKTVQHTFLTRQQLHTVVDMAKRGNPEYLFDNIRINRAIRFSEITVGEIMVPIAEVKAVDTNASVESALQLVKNHGYNRLPVFENNIGNITGIVTLTVWDLLSPQSVEEPLHRIVKKPLYIPSSHPIDELLPQLSQRKDHMAVIVDEFGSAVGIVTIEDIFEEVVGDFNIGYDFDEYRPRRHTYIEKNNEESYVIGARTAISEINELLELELPSVEFHTLGGFIESRLKRIPAINDTIEEDGWRFTVVDGTEKNIISVKAEKLDH